MNRALTALAFAALTLTLTALTRSSEIAAAPDEEKPLDAEPIPTDEADSKKPPKASEWVTATRVKLTRQGPRAAGCRAWRARSWLKIHCDVQTTALSLLGGKSSGVASWLAQPKAGEPAPSQAEVIFPMRPGDRRIFELFSFGETYGGSMVSPGLVLQEHWIEGEPAPVIVLR
jgi:hypothetical protein